MDTAGRVEKFNRKYAKKVEVAAPAAEPVETEAVAVAVTEVEAPVDAQ